MDEMYKGIPFSPPVALADSIGPADTVIKVTDITAFPDGPNYATIGTDEEGETIFYAAKTFDSLSGCMRGIEGTAKSWPLGSTIARNFTNKDFETIQKNIQKLTSLLDAIKDDIPKSADDLNALPIAGGTMDGPLHMNGKVLDGLNDPTEPDEAVRKAYVDKSMREAAPVNLLDNSDFTNPVNQRNVSTGNATDQYFIDRWKFNRNMDDATYQLVPGTGINLGAGTWLSQFIPLTQAQMDNKTYTIAVWLADGTVWVQPVLFTAQDSYVSAPWNNQGFGTWFTGESWRITLSNLPTCTIRHIALYEGEYTTDTLPEYKPKGYGAELAECQRYFYNTKSDIFIGQAYIASAGRVQITLPAEMRINPTIDTTHINSQSVAVIPIGLGIQPFDRVEFGVTSSGNRNIAPDVFITTSVCTPHQNIYVSGLELHISADL